MDRDVEAFSPLQQKVCLITGGNIGIGRETVVELIKLGAERIIIACRNVKSGEEAISYISKNTGIAESDLRKRIAVKQLDLGSLASVRQFASAINSEEQRLHILINNAGVFPPFFRGTTSDGFELSFGVNHLGHFLLTNLLLDLLKRSAPSRVIMVSSNAYNFAILNGGFHIDDPNFEQSWYFHMSAYAQSKLAMILFALELDRRLNADKPSGVTTYSVHPGNVDTRMQAFFTVFPQFIRRAFLISPTEGTKTTTFCAASDEALKDSGKYFMDGKVSEPSMFAKDAEMAKRLWDLSEKLVGSKF